jgi:hypothetical protein
MGIFIFHLHIKFQMPSISDLLVIVLKLKTKYWSHAPTIMFYILQRKSTSK